MRGLTRTSLSILLLSSSTLVVAWAPETRVRMSDDAVRFMPAGLRLALESHREKLVSGLLAPLLRGDVPERRPPSAGGRLDDALAAAAADLTRALATGEDDFDRIVERFGLLAHYVAEAGFPPAAAGDSGHRYGHFADFCESRRDKFPLVFYGHDAPGLDRGDYRAFVHALLEEAAADDAELARAYRAAGDPPDPSHFGDRSVPFAIGSLSYSRGVTSIVRAWLAVWGAAGGDIEKTPYLGLDERGAPSPAQENP